MIIAQFAEQHVERDGLRALGRKFLDQPAINLPRPVKPEFVTKRAVFDGGNAGILHRHEGEIGRGRRRETQGRPCPHIIGDPLQPFEKIMVEQAGTADKRQDENGQDDRRALDGFKFHHTGLNKKPEQLKVALV